MKRLWLLIFLAMPALAQEVSSVRQGSYDWVCETEAGVHVSGHTRQDKAFQRCFNEAAASGSPHYVKGGVYRITITGTIPPPVEPPPIEPPPVEPPPTGAQVTFGPVTGIVSYPASISALKQDYVRWEITFTANSLPTGSSGAMGLVSRDQSGQIEKGHIGAWLRSDGGIRVRHQDIEGGAPNIQLDSTTKITLGTEYTIVISIDVDNGIGLFVDGNLESSSPIAFGLTGNNLPLIVGGLCSSCLPDGTVGPDRAIDGSVFMEIWDDPLVLPIPVSGAAMLNWINPTERTDNTLLGPGLPDRITVYQDLNLIADLDGESIMYEVSNLAAGEHCFHVTAWAENRQSVPSNTDCKIIGAN